MIGIPIQLRFFALPGLVWDSTQRMDGRCFYIDFGLGEYLVWFMMMQRFGKIMLSDHDLTFLSHRGRSRGRCI